MSNRSLWVVLVSALMLSACIDLGDDGGGGGNGGGGTPLAGETAQVAEKTDSGTPGTPGAPPCAGTIGTSPLGAVVCTAAPAPIPAPVAGMSISSALKIILCNDALSMARSTVETLFGSCTGMATPGTPAKPNLTVYLRVRDPANSGAPNAGERTAVFPANATTLDKIKKLTITRSTEGDPTTGLPPAGKTRNPEGKNLIFEFVVQGPHTNEIKVGFSTADAKNRVNNAITGDSTIDAALASSSFLAAEAGKDYQLTSGTLTFPGNGTQCTAGTEPACTQILTVKPAPVDPLDPVPNTANNNHSNSNDNGVRTKLLNDFTADSDCTAGANNDLGELMAMRITAIAHTEPDNGNAKVNNGAPQLIQKAVIGSIKDDDCSGTPPPTVTTTFCGNADTGKALTIRGRSFAVLGTGSFAQLTQLNEQNYLARVVNGVLTVTATPNPVTGSGEGERRVMGNATMLPNTLVNDVFGTLANTATGPVIPGCSPLAIRAISTVENLDLTSNMVPLKIGALAAITGLCAARSPVEVASAPTADIQFSNLAAAVEASVALVGLEVGGMRITDAVNTMVAAANTTVPIPALNGTLVLNEQIATRNRQPTPFVGTPPANFKGTTVSFREVNALHLTTPQGELIVGHNSVGLSCGAPANDQLPAPFTAGGAGPPPAQPNPQACATKLDTPGCPLAPLCAAPSPLAGNAMFCTVAGGPPPATPDPQACAMGLKTAGCPLAPVCAAPSPLVDTPFCGAPPSANALTDCRGGLTNGACGLKPLCVTPSPLTGTPICTTPSPV